MATSVFNKGKAMQITYYNKVNDGIVVANFGVYLEAYGLRINNLSILKTNKGGWYISVPNFLSKDSGSWEKVVLFDEGKQLEFLKSARDAIEEYAKAQGEQVV